MPVLLTAPQRPRRIVILNPSAMLRVNYVKNPERPTIRIRVKTQGNSGASPGILRRCTPQNDRRRGPSVMPVQTGIQGWGGEWTPDFSGGTKGPLILSLSKEMSGRLQVDCIIPTYLLRSAARNSACVLVPFKELQALQSSCRLSTWSVPPLALGTM